MSMSKPDTREEPVGQVKVVLQDPAPVYFMARHLAEVTCSGDEKGDLSVTLHGTLLFRYRGKQYAIHARDMVEAVLRHLGEATDEEG